MQPNRPTSVLVVAIFHFILGGLGVLFGLIGLVGTAILFGNGTGPAPAAGTPAALSPTAQYQFFDAHLAYWKETDIAFEVVSLAISVLMIVAGVGLLSMKPWARTLSLLYVALSLIFQTIRFIYVVGFFLPVTMQFYDTVMPSLPGAPPPFVISLTKAAMMVGVFIALLGLIYPIVVVVLMRRRSVVAAFRGEAADPEDFGEPHDPERTASTDDGRDPEGYGQEPPGFRPEPDDRYGAGPR